MVGRDMNMRPKAKKIGLLDHMGGGNLGDDTIQTAVIYNIKKRWPSSIIYGFSMNPSDTQSRHGIQSYPIRRLQWKNPDGFLEGDASRSNDQVNTAPDTPNPFQRLLRKAGGLIIRKPRAVVAELAFLARSYSAIRPLDILIISGGGQLLDSWDGIWGYPYTILKWVSLARLAGTKCYFLNVGAGPIRRPLSKLFISWALRLADYVSFRDQKSKVLAQEIGFAGEAPIFPDCVYGLNVPATHASRVEVRNEPLVGLSPMAYCDPRHYWLRNQAAYDALVRKFVLFGAWLTERYRVTLFTTDIWFDEQTLGEVDAALKKEVGTDEARLITHEPIKVLESLISVMSSMDYIVTCRFHGVVFAHIMNKPVIAISHHPKVTTLMANLGLSEYCLNIDTFDLELLKSTFSRMVAENAAIKARMAKTAALYDNELTIQFDQLFPPDEIPSVSHPSIAREVLVE
jgi:polysaccharide pyruvyl transferase WcaK-like protein